MSKYIIVSKDKKGNNEGKYKITYTLRESPALRLSTHLYNISKSNPKYVFISGELTPFIKTDKDRDEFLKEFTMFQKGGSYRRQNPIIEQKQQQLNKQIMELEEQKRLLLKELNELDMIGKIRSIETTLNSINKTCLSKFCKDVSNIIKDNRFTISSRLNGYIIKVNGLDIPVAKITDNGTIRYLTPNEIVDMCY